jgi:PKD repeat protein
MLATAMTMAGCAVEQQTAPGLSGPSELGLSLAITASPDVIFQDGWSQSVIEVTARDSMSEPARNVTLAVQTTVGGEAIDFGQLSTKTISTNSEGRATVVYRSPAAPPLTATADQVVSVEFTPLGSNYSNSAVRNVEIRLRRPGVIVPPNGAPRPEFFFSPTAPKENDDVLFDGSASVDADGTIVSYEWNFGDGSVRTGMRRVHAYDFAGAYNVTLTVTDDRGQSTISQPQTVTVGIGSAPTAGFTFSPSTPKVGTLVTVNASASTPSTGRKIVDYDWDFGDGSGHTKGLTSSHTYSTPGNYTIVLRVTDDAGKTAAATAQVTVAP